MIHENVKATSFASLKDLAGFKKAKAEGMSDSQAFNHGDNGIGCWNDLTAQTHTAMCALHPDDMIAMYGSIEAARHRRILVVHKPNNRSAECIVGDRLPWERNTVNGASIDLNPAALDALELPYDDEYIVSWGEIERAQELGTA